jgi:hypothetical protein
VRGKTPSTARVSAASNASWYRTGTVNILADRHAPEHALD